MCKQNSSAILGYWVHVKKRQISTRNILQPKVDEEFYVHIIFYYGDYTICLLSRLYLLFSAVIEPRSSALIRLAPVAAAVAFTTWPLSATELRRCCREK